MTKVPHVVVFAIFFAFTELQLELEEGASRTGNCHPAGTVNENAHPPKEE